jgi:transcriptional regulator with XRE-family HTH domain
MKILPSQCRAARGLVGWTQRDLSERAGVGRSTVLDFESDARKPMAGTLEAITRALEAAGIEFSNGDAPGVKLSRMHAVSHPDQQERQDASARKVSQRRPAKDR